jgi:hypothetical protein
VNEEQRGDDPQAVKSEPKSNLKTLKKLASASPFIVSVGAVIISLFAYLNERSANESAQMSAEQTYAANSSFWLVYKPPPSVKLSKPDAARLQIIKKELQEWQAAVAAERTQIPSPLITSAPSPPLTSVIPSSRPTSVIILSDASGASVEAVIENRNNTPITNVDLVLDAQEGAGRFLSSESIVIGTVPPCSTATVNTITIGQVTNDLTLKLLTNMSLHGADYVQVTVSVDSMVFTDSNGTRWVRSRNGGFNRYSGQISNPTSIEYPASNEITAATGCLSEPKLGPRRNQMRFNAALRMHFPKRIGPLRCEAPKEEISIRGVTGYRS